VQRLILSRVSTSVNVAIVQYSNLGFLMFHLLIFLFRYFIRFHLHVIVNSTSLTMILHENFNMFLMFQTLIFDAPDVEF
jgi:hypothetical protein